MNEAEFYQWVKRIQSLRPSSTGTNLSSQDDEVGLDLIAAFRVFDRDENGFITKVNNILLFLRGLDDFVCRLQRSVKERQRANAS